jgi:hypothetical protein
MDLLVHGTEGLLSVNVQHKRGLKAWRGVNHFRESIAKEFANVAARDVYLAGRSRSLMNLGARMLSRSCRRILSVDLNWPVYQHELSEIAKQVDCELTVARIQDHLILERWDADDLTEFLCRSYERGRCDGLFLPAVDSMGIRLPIEEIVTRVKAKHDVRFVLVDAAQALGHTDLSEIAGCVDFIVAGTHKWVRSYIPLGVGVAANPASQQWIANFMNSAIGTNGAGDSLSHMLHSIDQGRDTRFPETVNLAGLFAGFGAWTATPSPRAVLDIRIANADRIASIAMYNGWKPLRPHKTMHSGSLLLQTSSREARVRSADEIRNQFEDCGIVISAYPNGIVRMAMPEVLLPVEQIMRIQDALYHTGNLLRTAC